MQGRSRHVVGYLRDFLFRDEQARQPVKALSGGERNRLLLAKILAQPANLLVLDEPTNDLDIDTLDLLEEMLADYRGHPAPGQPRPRLPRPAGHLDHRLRGRRPRRANMPAATATGCASGRHRRHAAHRAPRPAKRAGAGPRLRAFPAKLQRELDRLPDRIAALEGEIAALEDRLADPGLYARDPNAFAQASDELAAQRAALAALEERWLELEASARPRPADRLATAAGAQ